MEKKGFIKGEVFTFANEIEYADAGIVSKSVVKMEHGNVSLFAFDKGEALSEHTVPFDAIVQVIDGVAEIIVDHKSHIVANGESIIMPANIPHAVNAKEKFKMILTMMKL